MTVQGMHFLLYLGALRSGASSLDAVLGVNSGQLCTCIGNY